jgi:hypothetical protein
MRTSSFHAIGCTAGVGLDKGDDPRDTSGKHRDERDVHTRQHLQPSRVNQIDQRTTRENLTRMNTPTANPIAIGEQSCSMCPQGWLYYRTVP